VIPYRESVSSFLYTLEPALSATLSFQELVETCPYVCRFLHLSPSLMVAECAIIGSRFSLRGNRFILLVM